MKARKAAIVTGHDGRSGLGVRDDVQIGRRVDTRSRPNVLEDVARSFRKRTGCITSSLFTADLPSQDEHSTGERMERTMKNERTGDGMGDLNRRAIRMPHNVDPRNWKLVGRAGLKRTLGHYEQEVEERLQPLATDATDTTQGEIAKRRLEMTLKVF